MNDLTQKQLKWACRRGMLELDMLLEPFLAKTYPNLSQEERLIFQRLLTASDQELFQWFLGSASPDDADMKSMVEMIRSYAKTQPSD